MRLVARKGKFVLRVADLDAVRKSLHRAWLEGGK